MKSLPNSSTNSNSLVNTSQIPPNKFSAALNRPAVGRFIVSEVQPNSALFGVQPSPGLLYGNPTPVLAPRMSPQQAYNGFIYQVSLFDIPLLTLPQ